jgi:hypothetical protein
LHRLEISVALKLQELGFGHHEMADTEDQHSVSHPVRTTNLDTLFSQSVSGG